MYQLEIKIRKLISRKKETLINKAKTKGVYENFGQKEVREVNDFINKLDYSDRIPLFPIIDGFNEWCMTYSPH